jgi:hypothetical protein
MPGQCFKLYVDWDWAGADDDLRRALAQNPSSDVVHREHANWLSAMGREEAELAAARRGQRRESTSRRKDRAAASVAGALSHWV